MNYNQIRRKSKKITVGDMAIGGDAPISIQSMTNTDTHDAVATTEQIKLLEQGLDTGQFILGQAAQILFFCL